MLWLREGAEEKAERDSTISWETEKIECEIDVVHDGSAGSGRRRGAADKAQSWSDSPSLHRTFLRRIKESKTTGPGYELG